MNACVSWLPLKVSRNTWPLWQKNIGDSAPTFYRRRKCSKLCQPPIDFLNLCRRNWTCEYPLISLVGLWKKLPSLPLNHGYTSLISSRSTGWKCYLSLHHQDRFGIYLCSVRINWYHKQTMSSGYGTTNGGHQPTNRKHFPLKVCLRCSEFGGRNFSFWCQGCTIYFALPSIWMQTRAFHFVQYSQH